jgi:two-component system, OmpR family, copper resistance phosphate regulon response regulator CusR
MRALVVEDDELITQIIVRLLEQEGFVIDAVATAAEGRRLARVNDYSLITLDMLLPDGHGMSVLEVIRERRSTASVLIVSGKSDIDTIVRGLDAGADDYLQKPFQPAELRARVRALFRRGHFGGTPTIACGNIMLHRMERYATVAGERLDLTAKEYALLEYLLTNQGKTVTRADLLEKVWRFDFDPGTNMVDVNVSRLRAKLVGLGASCRVDAERGIGYMFSVG